MDEDEVRARALGWVGSMVGPHRLERLLGIGGMAAVFAGTRMSDGARVALKILHPELAPYEAIRQRFVLEGSVASRIAHPGVVQVLGSGELGQGWPYLVLELLDGATLETYRKHDPRPLPYDEAMSIACALLDVLDVAHRAGIVHRDIKPENVFVTHAGTIKLMDFGIARLVDGSNGTRTGALMGTPAFMSPEQAAGLPREVEARSDVWSVGALLFMLLTGEEVHLAPNDQVRLIYAATQHARPIATAAPLVPKPLARIVDVALAFDRERRWPSAEAMNTALRDAAAQLGLRMGPLPVVGGSLEDDGEERAPPTLMLGSAREP